MLSSSLVCISCSFCSISANSFGKPSGELARLCRLPPEGRKKLLRLFRGEKVVAVGNICLCVSRNSYLVFAIVAYITKPTASHVPIGSCSLNQQFYDSLVYMFILCVSFPIGLQRENYRIAKWHEGSSALGLPPHHLINYTHVALNDLHHLGTNVLFHIIRHRDTVIPILIHGYRCIYSLQQALLINTGDEEACLPPAFYSSQSQSSSPSPSPAGGSGSS